MDPAGALAHVSGPGRAGGYRPAGGYRLSSPGKEIGYLMRAYIIRRVLFALPILIGVNIITFSLFFVVNTPDDMARIHLGVKRVTPEAVVKWKQERGYDKPLLLNSSAPGTANVTDTIFFDKSIKLFAFQFGLADDGRDIAYEIKTR